MASLKDLHLGTVCILGTVPPLELPHYTALYHRTLAQTEWRRKGGRMFDGFLLLGICALLSRSDFANEAFINLRSVPREAKHKLPTWLQEDQH